MPKNKEIFLKQPFPTLTRTHKHKGLRKILTETEHEGQQHPHQTWLRPHLLSHLRTTASDFTRNSKDI